MSSEEPKSATSRAFKVCFPSLLACVATELPKPEVFSLYLIALSRIFFH